MQNKYLEKIAGTGLTRWLRSSGVAKKNATTTSKELVELYTGSKTKFAIPTKAVKTSTGLGLIKDPKAVLTTDKLATGPSLLQRAKKILTDAEFNLERRLKTNSRFAFNRRLDGVNN